jgi:hypothetical protein
MRGMRLTLRRLGLLSAALLTSVACSDKAVVVPSSAGAAGAESCSDGELGCACYGNRTCDRGLSCDGRVCVTAAGSGDAEGGAPAGGTSTVGGSGTSGTSGGASGAPDGEAGDGMGGRQSMGGSQSVGGRAGSDSGGETSGGAGADPAGNMISSNGSFDSELNDWVANPDIGDITADGSNSRACLTTGSSGQFTLAWPSDFSLAFTIKPGVNYRLSYRAVSTLGIEISVQIRQPQSPYTFYVNERETLTQTWAAHSHTFSLSSGGSNRGIALIGSMSSTGTTCFDDVVLEQVP